MSGVNISYEIDSSGEGFQYINKPINSEHTNYANVVAGEIVNEILENALDIATRASQTGLHWRDIKDSRSNLKASMNNSQRNYESTDGKIVKSDNIPIDNICSNIVEDIVENYGGVTSPPQISDIIDSLNIINRNDGVNRHEEVLPLDVEMKKLLSEMMTPPYEIINYESYPKPSSGVGDQSYCLPETFSEELKQESPNPVEKKSRATDLVKNSPRLISEFLISNKPPELSQEEWEENEEKVVNVIELECIEPGERPYRAPPNPYSVPKDKFVAHDYNEEAINSMTQSEVMETVNLSGQAFREERRRLNPRNEQGDLAQGDEKKPESKNAALFSDVTTENKTKEACDVNSKLRDVISVNAGPEKVKKKKTSLGHRILGFFKKSHKEVGQSSSTAT